MKYLTILSIAAGAAVSINAASSANATAADRDRLGNIDQATTATPEAEVADTTFTTLDELVIEADKPMIQTDGRILTYNAEEDKSSSSGNVLDLLRKVPSLSVDGDGNISINGKSGFRIHVNGKEQPMLTQNASKILKNMPASMIKKVEVNTEPGAKYDAEGNAGIINLITESEQKEDGYSGSLALGGSRTGGAYLNAYGITRLKKVTLSANLSYANGNLLPQENLGFREIIYHSDNQTGRLLSETKQKVGFDYGDVNLNLSWEPSVNDLFTLSASYNGIDAKIKDFRSINRRYDSEGMLLWNDNSNSSGYMKNQNVTVNASFQHNFRPENNNLTLSYLFNFGGNELDILNRYDEGWEAFRLYPLLHNNNYNLTREHTIQADYINGFGSAHHLLETGGKAIFRHNGTFSYSKEGNTVGNLENINDAQVVMSQIQNVYALYGAYTGKFDKFTTLAGVRYEHTHMGIDYRHGNTPDFRTNLNDIVPNAAVSYNFGPATNIRLAYQMRISRPGLYQVNPYKQNALGYIIQAGNPDLKSEHSNNVNLTFSKFGRIFGGNIGIEYNHVGNMIAEYKYLENNILVSTYGNLGTHRTAGLNGFLNASILRNMNANISAALNFQDYNAPTMKMKNHGWGWQMNASWNYNPEDWHFSAWGGYNSPRILIDGKSGEFHYYGISAGRDMLADKSLNITLAAMNMFEEKMHWKSVSYSTDADYISRNSSRGWNIALSITWKFGKLNTRVRETSGKIINNDTNRTSSGTGISAGSGGH